MAQDQDVEKYPVLASLKHPETVQDGPDWFPDTSNLLGHPDHKMDAICEELCSDLCSKERRVPNFVFPGEPSSAGVWNRRRGAIWS